MQTKPISGVVMELVPTTQLPKPKLLSAKSTTDEAERTGLFFYLT